MRVTHSIPAAETDDHLRLDQCPCDPAQRVTATPDKRRPHVLVIHQPLTPKEPQ